MYTQTRTYICINRHSHKNRHIHICIYTQSHAHVLYTLKRTYKDMHIDTQIHTFTDRHVYINKFADQRKHRLNYLLSHINLLLKQHRYVKITLSDAFSHKDTHANIKKA